MEKMNMKKISANLRKLRGKKTVDELSQLLGVCKSTIYMYESGKRVPNDDVKKKYACIFKTTVDKNFFS